MFQIEDTDVHEDKLLHAQQPHEHQRIIAATLVTITIFTTGSDCWVVSLNPVSIGLGPPQVSLFDSITMSYFSLFQKDQSTNFQLCAAILLL